MESTKKGLRMYNNTHVKMKLENIGECVCERREKYSRREIQMPLAGRSFRPSLFYLLSLWPSIQLAESLFRVAGRLHDRWATGLFLLFPAVQQICGIDLSRQVGRNLVVCQHVHDKRLARHRRATRACCAEQRLVVAVKRVLMLTIRRRCRHV